MGPVVFDAYGTLFDVTAAARRAAAEPGREALRAAWPKLAADWREKQIDYSRLRTIVGEHADFRVVTGEALDWALAANGLAGDAGLRDRLMALYDDLDAFPEAREAVAALRAAGRRTAILSNGAPEMLARAVAAAGMEGMFDAILSAEAVGRFKPAAEVYGLVEAEFGCAPAETLFVSSNGWDAACAARRGFVSVWVNRTGAPVERLPWRPAHVATDLSAVPGIAAEPELRRFIASDGVELAYRDEGQGPVLLCLPGLTRNGEDFLPVSERFSDRARVIRLDFRGRGRSAFSPDYMDYSVLREARDVIELMDGLGIGRFAILGTSRGGIVALGLAAVCPERLTGVVLNDIGPAVSPEGLARIMGYLGVTPDYPDLEAAAEGLMRTNGAQFPGAELAAWRRQAAAVWRELPGGGLALRYDPRLRAAMIEQSAAGIQFDLWPMLDRFGRVPLILLRGENSDVLSAETAEKMQARRPDLRYVVVRDRGHVPFLDEPESVAALEDFVTEIGG